MRHRLLLLLLILGMILLSRPTLGGAQDDLPPPGVDIVFMVDQSGSMSRGTIINNNHPDCSPVRTDACPRTNPTDPDGLALQALREGLPPIFNQIMIRSQGRDIPGLIKEEYRFGVVLFGGDSDPSQGIRVAVPLTRVEVETDATGTLHSNIEDMLPTAPEQLGETAFSYAFDAVCTMLDCNTPLSPGRKRVVVLLTDGRPSLDRIGFDSENPAPYFNALQQHHANLFDTADIYVFGLDKGVEFWEKTAPYWRDIATDEQAIRLTDPGDIADEFRQIALGIVGEPPGEARTCDGSNFSVKPYLDTLTLLLEYPDTNSKAEFTLPDAEKLTKESLHLLGYSYTGLSEMFIIENPTPGEWSCQIVGTGVTPQFRDIEGKFNFARVSVGYSAGLLASTCRDFGLTVTYYDKDGNTISELPAYRLDQSLGITIDGSTVTRALIPIEGSSEQWQIDGSLTPGITGGEYPLTIEVRYQDEELFKDDTQSVTIDPSLPCMQITQPRDGGTSSMHQRLSTIGAEIVVELTQGGELATPDGVFREDLSRIISGQLEGPDGYQDSIWLEPDPERPGRFSTLVDGLDTQGDYTFTATLQGTTQEGEVYQLTPQTISFRRTPGTLWLAIEWTKRFGALIAMIIAMIAAAFFVFLITGPFPRGTLILEEKTSGALAQAGRQWDMLRSFSLSGQKIFFGLFRTRWPTIKKGLPKQAGIRKLTVRRLKSGQNEGVTVTLIRSDKRSPMTLKFMRDNESHPFDSKYRIRYENPYGTRKKP